MYFTETEIYIDISQVTNKTLTETMLRFRGNSLKQTLSTHSIFQNHQTMHYKQTENKPKTETRPRITLFEKDPYKVKIEPGAFQYLGVRNERAIKDYIKIPKISDNLISHKNLVD